MHSNAVRSIWLSTLWSRLIPAFKLSTLPTDVLVTVGFPSRAARGADAKRLPAEFIAGEWQGNVEEKAQVSIHPERFTSAREVAKAMLFAASRAMYGRQGPKHVGLRKESADLILESGASNIVDAICTELGDPPSGFALLTQTRNKVQTTRMHKYSCPGCGRSVRASAKWALQTITHTECNQALIPDNQNTIGGF